MEDEAFVIRGSANKIRKESKYLVDDFTGLRDEYKIIAQYAGLLGEESKRNNIDHDMVIYMFELLNRNDNPYSMDKGVLETAVRSFGVNISKKEDIIEKVVSDKVPRGFIADAWRYYQMIIVGYERDRIEKDIFNKLNSPSKLDMSSLKDKILSLVKEKITVKSERKKSKRENVDIDEDKDITVVGGDETLKELEKRRSSKIIKLSSSSKRTVNTVAETSESGKESDKELTDDKSDRRDELAIEGIKKGRMNIL